MPNEEDTKITITSISNATSYWEIGEFWDENSLDEFWEQTHPVEFNVNLESQVTYCRLDRNISEQLKEVAKRRGISVETLVNLWLQDKLQQDKV